MSYSNELTIRNLRYDGSDKDLLEELEALDRDIDMLLQTGGNPRDVRLIQEHFDDLLPSE